jgi:hypothetical protein
MYMPRYACSVKKTKQVIETKEKRASKGNMDNDSGKRRDYNTPSDDGIEEEDKQRIEMV